MVFLPSSVWTKKGTTMIGQNLLSNKNNILLDAFFSFKGRPALACFPFEGEDFSWNVVPTRRREVDAEEDQEQPAAVVGSMVFFESWSEIPRYQLSTSASELTRRGRSSGRHASAKCIVTGWG